MRNRRALTIDESSVKEKTQEIYENISKDQKTNYILSNNAETNMCEIHYSDECEILTMKWIWLNVLLRFKNYSL
jgi:hypothetical protein